MKYEKQDRKKLCKDATVSQNRINIIGGYVQNFQAYINLIGNEHFSFSGSVLDLTDYGVRVTEGTVGNFGLWGFSAYESSTVEMSGGIVSGRLNTYDESTVDILGGEVGSLNIFDCSTLNISVSSQRWWSCRLYTPDC